jgi:Ca2+-binding EF-hand superfamily protein
MYNIDWDKIIEDCDQNGDGVIDFQEFMTACINRKALNNKTDVKIAFQILDVNKDGKISIEDFDELFCSYGGAKMDTDIWEQLLAEADKNGDGAVSEDEFTEAMCNMIRASLKMKKKGPPRMD